MKRFLSLLLTLLAGASLRLPAADLDRLAQILKTSPEQDARDKASREAEAAWAQRVFVEPFRARLKGEPWNAQATAFVDLAVASWLDPYRDGAGDLYRGMAELADDGEALLKTDCHDPLAMYLTAMAIYAGDLDNPGVNHALDRAKKAAEKVPTSNALKRFINRFGMAFKAREEKRFFMSDAAKDAALAKAAWQDGTSYLPGEVSIYVRHEAGEYKGPTSEAPEEYGKAYQDLGLPEWAQLTLDGTVEIARGWKARGGDVASTVTQEGWKGLETHFKAGSVLLQKAWALNKNEPYAANEMISVTMGGGGDESPLVWFERGVAASFNQRQAYAKIILSVQPRWGGSDALTMRLARAFLATKRFDTVVPLMYRNGHSYITDKGYTDPKTAGELQALFEGLRDEPARKSQRAYWSQWLAAYAWLGHDYDRAAQAFQAAGGKLGFNIQKVLKLAKVEPAVVESELALSAAKQLDRYRGAEKLLKDGQAPAALAALDAIENAAGPGSQAAVSSLRAAAEFERALATGQPVPVRFPDALPGWTRRYGNWTASGGALICQGSNYSASILAPGRAGRRFTVKGKMDLKCPDGNSRQFMLMAGMTLTDPAHPEALAFGAYQKEKGEAVGAFHADSSEVPIPGTKALLQDKNTFVFKVDGNKVSLDLNGTTVISEVDSSTVAAIPTGGRWGFYMPRAYGKNTWKIYDVEVQRLP